MNQKKFNLNQEFKNIVKKYGNKIAVNYGNEKKYDFNFLDAQSNNLLLIFKGYYHVALTPTTIAGPAIAGKIYEVF